MAKLVLGDVVLTAEDARTLEPRQWLEDQVIAFQLERLHRAAGSPKHLLLLEPSLGFTATMVPNAASLREMLSVTRTKEAGAGTLAQALAAAELVLLPVSNNDDASQVGGSHWSLLVYRRRSGADGAGPSRFEHYDSCGNANAAFAKGIALKFIPLLQPTDRGPTLKLVSMTTPQQVNGFDCGMYVLAIAEVMVQAHAEGGAEVASEALRERVTAPGVAAKREALLKELREGLARGSL